MENENKKYFKRLIVVAVILALSIALYFIKEHSEHQEELDNNNIEASVKNENVNVEVENSNDNSESERKSIYPDSEVKKASDVAKQFVRSIYSFDGKHPDKGFKDAKKYATETLVKMIEDGGVENFRPTADYFSRSVSSINVQIPKNETDEFLTLDVHVTGDVLNKNGKVTKTEEKKYLVRFEKNKSEYKVADYVIDPE
ncbi:hypothetical protein [Bacillus sp. FSL M8-0168]|uniref:hypothetical protein n=1 Tax=Bacillus sp. FSL M8-0168 TaxID=2921614 RepID=UPI0030FD31D9